MKTFPQFIEIHIIQTLPPSNPNRGEDNGPKTITFGGETRYRLSSQAQKRAARKYYQNYLGLDRSLFAVRSRRFALEIATILMNRSEAQEIRADLLNQMAKIVLSVLSTQAPEKIFELAREDDGGNMLFFCNHELNAIAQFIIENKALLFNLAERVQIYAAMKAAGNGKDFKEYPSSKEIGVIKVGILKALKDMPIGDVALFGRFMTNVKELTVDGCVQVAHAISVNSARNTSWDESNGRRRYGKGEVDFWTAADDLTNFASDSRGGIIGTTLMCSPTHYRYANICMSELNRLVGDTLVAKEIAAAFIESFVRSLPTGFETSMAHGCLPELVQLIRRNDSPYNLAIAFERPIDQSGGISAIAAKQLLKTQQAFFQMYGSDGVEMITTTGLPEIMGDASIPLKNAIERVLEHSSASIEGKNNGSRVKKSVGVK